MLSEFAPDRIIIEPSGVGKLSDVIKAVEGIGEKDIVLNSFTTVADATKCKMYMKNFGEFYNNQIEHANSIILSRTDGMNEEKLAESIAMLKEKNPSATIITTAWNKLDGKAILDAMEHRDTMKAALELIEEEQCHEHEHENEHDHEHEHEHEHCHEHEHDENCTCGCHDHEHGHDHSHHHHADEVFVSCGAETAKKYTKEEIENILDKLSDEKKYGTVLRAKGIVDNAEGDEWLHFDYVPGESDVRNGSAGVIGRICVIGSKINEDAVKQLFGII